MKFKSSTVRKGCKRFHQSNNIVFSVTTDYTLNIYRPLNVTASGQKNPNGAIWKPIDGVLDQSAQGSSNEYSWVSVSLTSPWWRMELPRRTAISSVVIHTRMLDSSRRARMDGFVVYVGDSTHGNGSNNALCGAPWAAVDTRVIVNTCSNSTFGKFLYVAGAERAGVKLYLNEIYVYGCEGISLYPSPSYTVTVL